MSILTVLAASTLASGLDLHFNTMQQVGDRLTPQTGDKMPPFSQTFPGCDCVWEDSRGKWKCDGTIAFPEELQGQKCGCCGLKCLPDNRKSDSECLAGGFDQQAELEAERIRLEKLLKGADLLLGDDLPAFIVTLVKKGHCTNSLLTETCKSKGMTPVCDHTSYRTMRTCYTPGKSPGRFYNRHFSHFGSHRDLMKLDVNDEIFYGMCFQGNNGNWALAPTAGSHGWTNSVAPAPRPGLSRPKATVPNAKMNDGTGELGMWRTLCVKKDPNP